MRLAVTAVVRYGLADSGLWVPGSSSPTLSIVARIAKGARPHSIFMALSCCRPLPHERNRKFFALAFLIFELTSIISGHLSIIQDLALRYSAYACSMPLLKVSPWMDPRTFWVGGADPPIDNSNTATVIIKLLRVQDDREGKRAWDIEIKYNGKKIHDEPQLELFDRFVAQDYDNYFKFFADDSIDPSQRSPELKQQIWTAEEKIKKYGDDLLCQLKLDSEHPERRHKNLNMLIVEEREINDNDQKSLHNIVWELLEHPQCWKNRRINRVNITRIICPRTRPLRSNSNTELHDDGKPVRILLITGRSLEKKHFNKTNWKYTEKVRPSLIQHPLMQVMQHLDDIGCKRKVQLDILRPATFGELTSYLGVDQNDPAVMQNFDIIHVDLHGEMRRPVPRSGDQLVPPT